MLYQVIDIIIQLQQQAFFSSYALILSLCVAEVAIFHVGMYISIKLCCTSDI